IPPDVIVRRYHHGISNLFNLFMPIVDSWTIIDNTRCRPRVVANDTLTLAPELYERIKKDGEKQSD
ncbi:MAG: zeta toxin, partial [Duncaniella sp.]|nr:zeta toxin [Duncaniella sp.]